MRKVSIVLLMILMAAFALMGCRKGTPIQNHQASVTTVNDLTEKEVRAAIITACPRYGWAPKDVGPGIVEATLHHRAHTVVVDIHYTPKSYEIKYKSSVNMHTSDGNIHPNYNKWVMNLRRTIDAELASIAARK